MKEIWTKSWKKVLIWLCGYLSIIAYAIVGGYAIVKSNDKELQKTAKLVLVITLIFTAIEALIAILSGIASLNVNMGTALNWISFFVLLAKIGIFAAGIIMTLCDVSLTSSRTEQKKETKAETSNASAAKSEPASAESSAAESNESEKTE